MPGMPGLRLHWAEQDRMPRGTPPGPLRQSDERDRVWRTMNYSRRQAALGRLPKGTREPSYSRRQAALGRMPKGTREPSYSRWQAALGRTPKGTVPGPLRQSDERDRMLRSGPGRLRRDQWSVKGSRRMG